METTDIARRLHDVKDGLPQGVQLVAVSKFHPADYIMAAYNAGQRIFGESREQELAKKVEALPKDIEWHFIGHLQTNKVRQVVGQVDLIQSVDSARLLQAINNEAQRRGIVQNVLLEVNIGGESSKSGFLADEILPFMENIAQYPNVCVMGLMAIPPISQKKGDNVKFFQKIFQLLQV